MKHFVFTWLQSLEGSKPEIEEVEGVVIEKWEFTFERWSMPFLMSYQH